MGRQKFYGLQPLPATMKVKMLTAPQKSNQVGAAFISTVMVIERLCPYED
jgi:hypothetical protein